MPDSMKEPDMMLLGNILAAKGLVDDLDITRALDFQRENGGRFGDCLIALGITTKEVIEDVINQTPKAPRNIKEMDVDPLLLLQLMIKVMYSENLEIASQISETTKLPDSVIQSLLEQATERKLVEIIGQSETIFSGFGEIRYSLTRSGRDWAVESLEHNQYVGPAPISLEAYVERVLKQHITNEWVSRSAIETAFGDMVIPERFLDRLGPGINSGSAMLIYGPAGNGKTTIAEKIGHVFNNVIFIPYCFEVDGQIVKVFDPSIHKAVSGTEDGETRPVSIQRDQTDRRWVACHRPMVIAGGELTLDMLDLQFSEISRFYEAPLHIKALNGIFLIDDFGRQRAEPEDILNRWIMPLNSHFDYLKLHTGKSFQLPFDELLIFSTNMHPDELMDPAFLRRISYKLETVPPSEALFRQVFEKVADQAGLDLTEEICQKVIQEIHANGAELAYYHPGFIISQVLASCRFHGNKPQFTPENVEDALLNLFVKSEYEGKAQSKISPSAPPALQEEPKSLINADQRHNS